MSYVLEALLSSTSRPDLTQRRLPHDGDSDMDTTRQLDRPGQQVQTVEGREDDGIPLGVMLLVVLFVLILAVAITCGVLRLCKKEDGDRVEGPAYSVAISNRLFKGGLMSCVPTQLGSRYDAASR